MYSLFFQLDVYKRQDLSGDIPEKREAHLQVIMDESERLNQIVSDMATISAMQTHKTILERGIFDFISATSSLSLIHI